MKNMSQLIPETELTFLQAYLHKTFLLENKCRDNFENTAWYLGERYSDDEVDLIIDYFKEIGIQCDCDLIRKFENIQIDMDSKND